MPTFLRIGVSGLLYFIGLWIYLSLFKVIVYKFLLVMIRKKPKQNKLDLRLLKEKSELRSFQ